jgi:hypothetical protein
MESESVSILEYMSDTLSFILRYCQGKKLACD